MAFIVAFTFPATVRAIWYFLIASSVAATIAFGLSIPKMPERKYRVLRNLLLSCYAVVLVLYALVSSGGFFVLGGRVNPFIRTFLIAPLVAPLLMLVCITSMRWAAGLMWLLFLFLHSYYCWVNWPSFYAMIKMLSFDWPLWTAALFLSLVTVQDRRRFGAATISKSTHS